MSGAESPEPVPPAARMMQMITGHWVSQIVATLARLGVPDAVAAGAATSSAVAERCGSDPDATRRLLRTATGLGLFVEEPPGTVRLTPLGETLRRDQPGSMRDFAIAETDEAHWLSWGQMAKAVRSGEAAAPGVLGQEPFEWYGSHPEDAAVFAGAMGNLSAMVAGQVATHYDFSTVARVVDVGGSHGVLLTAVLAKHPKLSGIVFDRPDVAEGARGAGKSRARGTGRGGGRRLLHRRPPGRRLPVEAGPARLER